MNINCLKNFPCFFRLFSKTVHCVKNHAAANSTSLIICGRSTKWVHHSNVPVELSNGGGPILGRMWKNVLLRRHKLAILSSCRVVHCILWHILSSHLKFFCILLQNISNEDILWHPAVSSINYTKLMGVKEWPKYIIFCLFGSNICFLSLYVYTVTNIILGDQHKTKKFILKLTDVYIYSIWTMTSIWKYILIIALRLILDNLIVITIIYIECSAAN